MTGRSLATYRRAIVRVFPGLAGSPFGLAAAGWDSDAVEVDGRLMFKFPRHRRAATALRREAALLAVIRPSITMAVPLLRLHEGPPLFSSHEKLRGGHLLAADYAELSEPARQRLGEELARFYAELHGLGRDVMAAAGAGPIAAWQTPAAIRAKALPLLPPVLRPVAKDVLDAFECMPPDPGGQIYGFFDGHGWNMAFDHARGRLNGIYDFADSGLGPLHQEFIYSNFVSSDLTDRIVAGYQRRTGRLLDRRRIALLTGVHRLSELAELASDPGQVPEMVRHVEEWLS